MYCLYYYTASLTLQEDTFVFPMAKTAFLLVNLTDTIISSLIDMSIIAPVKKIKFELTVRSVYFSWFQTTKFQSLPKIMRKILKCFPFSALCFIIYLFLISLIPLDHTIQHRGFKFWHRNSHVAIWEHFFLLKKS